MNSIQSVLDWFKKTLVIHLSSPDRAQAVMARLAEMGFNADPNDHMAEHALLAISAAKSGDIAYYFVNVDSECSLPAGSTVSDAEFLTFPVEPVAAQVTLNKQRKAKERLASEQLLRLKQLDLRELNDTQLDAILQVCKECNI